MVWVGGVRKRDGLPRGMKKQSDVNVCFLDSGDGFTHIICQTHQIVHFIYMKFIVFPWYSIKFLKREKKCGVEALDEQQSKQYKVSGRASRSH